jgi:D-alanyl-D-alanine carboxypeptidase
MDTLHRLGELDQIDATTGLAGGATPRDGAIGHESDRSEEGGSAAVVGHGWWHLGLRVGQRPGGHPDREEGSESGIVACMADGRVGWGARHGARRVVAAALLLLLVAGLGGVFTFNASPVAFGERSGTSPAPSTVTPSPVASLTAAVGTPPMTPPPAVGPTPAPTAVPRLDPSAAPQLANEERSCQAAAAVLNPLYIDPVVAQSLQSRLDTTRAALGVPGVSVAIVWDDGLTWTGVSGNADVAAHRRVTPATGFSLASISKTFTAAVVLELIAEGHFGLDAPVAPLLPEYGLDHRITIRMLLDHTSGLPDFFTTQKADTALAKRDVVWTAAMSWSFVPKYHRTPGSAYLYSNTNYVLLGELIRKVTGNAPSVEIRRRLLDPLGLDHTWYQQDEAPLAPLPAAYMIRWFSGVPVPIEVAPAGPVVPFRSVVTAAGAAGGMAATALDTARWIGALIGGRVLPPAMLNAMVDDQATTLALNAPASYGLGISTVNMAGYPGLGHSGRYLGARNVVRYIRDLKLSIAVLTNQREVDPARFGSDLVKVVVAAGPVARVAPTPACSPNAGWPR